MTKKQTIQLFEEKKVRTVWDDEQEKWFFCVVDVVEVLTESKDPKGYIKKMKQRDPELSKGWGQIVTPLSVQTAGGPYRHHHTRMEWVHHQAIQALQRSEERESARQYDQRGDCIEHAGRGFGNRAVQATRPEGI